MNRIIPRLHLIGPLDIGVEAFRDVATAAVRGGCDAVHVRLPGGATRDVLNLARAIRNVAGGTTLLINDRLDVALVVGADGVQLAERGFSVEDARAILPSRMLIGRSVHDIDGAQAAEASGVDYVLAGHVFETPSKHGVPGRGLDWLAQLVAAVSVPVIALGGITSQRIPDVLATGAHGVALGRELLLSNDPERSARDACAATGISTRTSRLAG